ncbi:hypothetical protein [[Mycoplasma] anseris]|uniref:Uncharacterized protein n=1 Tax=[Mycoplasma] anseris TaxID=92400 RepID=A0A2Z4NCV4_9BACT|nr:hypothetical protein [[Mycoplasma] anseris]AWX69404.1 hypothetical protein DP065_01380 [[Mycoplasma] anseris]
MNQRHCKLAIANLILGIIFIGLFAYFISIFALKKVEPIDTEIHYLQKYQAISLFLGISLLILFVITRSILAIFLFKPYLFLESRAIYGFSICAILSNICLIISSILIIINYFKSK